MSKKEQNLEAMRHSLSHIMAMAVTEMFPEAKLGIGPVIENGFYYDFDLPRTLIPEDLPLIEEKMQEIIKRDKEFEKFELPTDEARNLMKERRQEYKLELINDLEEEGEKTVSFYQSGDFVDLCRGPHVESTSKVGAFKLSHISGAYWKGDEKKPMMQRIYGYAFPAKKELSKFLKSLEEAKKRDHRKLGEKLDLFSFSESAPGFPFWHHRGMIIKNEIIKYWRKKHKEEGYREIQTPILLREELWHQSGHWDNYKENMYFTSIDKEKYAVKPMNCPGGIEVYKNSLHSYREFPLRIAELGLVHRHELSGVVHGLFRARAFTQDDAHIYCMENQVKDELEKVIRMVEETYRDFGFSDYHVELSTKPDKYIGSDEIWEKAQKTMKDVADKMKLKIKVNEGDGAFYGPKFDFHIKDSLGRTWQCATIQLDFSMPERFQLEYIDEDGKKKRPVMIHRTILGSLERFIGILIEHYGGDLPLWLSPSQVAIIPVSSKFNGYANKISKQLSDKKIRTEVDTSDETVGKKIRNAEKSKYPYMLVVGEKEQKGEKVSVRIKGEKEQKEMKVSDLVSEIKTKIKKKK